MSRMFFIAALLFCFLPLSGAKIDRTSQEALLKSWLKAIIGNDADTVWNALSPKTQEAIKKEYPSQAMPQKWFEEVQEGICRFAGVKKISALRKDEEKMQKIIERYYTKVTFVQAGNIWQLSSPVVEGAFYTPAPAAKKSPAASVGSRQNQAPAKITSKPVESESERYSIALRVVRAVVKKDFDGLWQCIAPSNRTQLIAKCGSEAKAKKDSFMLLCMGVAVNCPTKDIPKSHDEQSATAEKMAEKENSFVDENGKVYVIAVKYPKK